MPYISIFVCAHLPTSGWQEEEKRNQRSNNVYFFLMNDDVLCSVEFNSQWFIYLFFFFLNGLNIWDLLADVNIRSRILVLMNPLHLSSSVSDLLVDISHVCKRSMAVLGNLWPGVPRINPDFLAGWISHETILVAKGRTLRLGLAAVIIMEKVNQNTLFGISQLYPTPPIGGWLSLSNYKDVSIKKRL